jgi:peptidoglycan/xylan/chitin deacetylase (PgdA/CDA1 family)
VSSFIETRQAIRCGARTIAQSLLPSSLVVWRGKASSRRVALTFDDGPCKLTAAYLAVLRYFRARATFFVIGESCAKRPELVSQIAADGHELAGHGYTHRRFPTLSAAELQDELFRTERLLPANATGRRIVRPPHGAVSLASMVTCARAGFTTALWSYDSGDWCTKRSGDVRAAFDDREASNPGAIVLLHEDQEWTLNALPSVLDKLKGDGHELVTVGELLAG